MKNTIFFGNGFNLTDDKEQTGDKNLTWDALLTKIAKNQNLKRDFKDDIVYTLFYEELILNSSHKHIFSAEEKIKCDIAEELSTVIATKKIERIAEMDIDNYVTTNYDYALQNTLYSNNFECFYDDGEEYNTESIYSIRRKTTMKNGNIKKHIWNIHGEIKKPKTIMLGNDHYCGYVGKINGYVKGKYDWKKKDVISINKKLKKQKFNDKNCFSWIDLFFTTDVHMMGFGLDRSEIDIWWILNRRARLKKDKNLNKLIQNKIYYYGDISKEKKAYLEAFDVRVEERKDKDWSDFNEEVFTKLDKQNAKRRRRSESEKNMFEFNKRLNVI